MRCKVCDYQLWNLPSRQCPECGTAFCVSDYEFIPNSVRFCCPHCSQPYYGTGYQGHLAPESFACVTCGQPLHMNDMVLLPAEGLEDEQTEVYRIPWLQRAKIGWLKAWWATVRLALFRPVQMMRGVPPATGLGQAWRFAAANQLLAISPAELMLFAFVGAWTGALRGPVIPMAAWFLFLLAAGILIGLVGIAIWAAVAHVVLRLTGGTKHTFGRTCEALCYSSGVSALLMLPLCGMYFCWIWWLISSYLTLKEAQRVHGARATLAILTLPALLIGGSHAAAVVSRLIPMRVGVTGMSPANATVMVAGPLRSAALTGNGQGPRHAAELIVQGTLLRQALQLAGSNTVPENLRVGGVLLSHFDQLPLSRKNAAVQAAASALPQGLIAYRFGDFVFTYPGIDFTKADPGLWTVIAWPDPDINPAPAQVAVGLVNGSTQQFPVPFFQRRLGEQNALRAQYNLPALPNPTTVTHALPATSLVEEMP